MELVPILIAGVAAGAILLIFLGLTNRSSVDPVQARLTQLGAMQAKNLEELSRLFWRHLPHQLEASAGLRRGHTVPSLRVL